MRLFPFPLSLRVLPLVLIVGCSQSFDPVSNVEGFRVLDLRASPPDLHPGDATQLDALVVDPKNPSAPTSVLYLGCDPAPDVNAENPCARYETISDPSQLVAADGGLPEGAHFLGANTASYVAPSGLFDGVASNDLVRQRGVLAVILGIALEADVTSLPSGDAAQALIQQVLSKQVPSQLVIKRIRISEDSNLNHNPVLGLVASDADVLGKERPLILGPGDTAALFARASAFAQEPYTAIGPDGTQDARTETPVVSWFTSSGSLNASRTVDTDPEQSFTAADGSSEDAVHAIPADRRFTLWVVLRDGRGGSDWTSVPGLICDPSLPGVELSSAEVLGASVVVRGSHLDTLVEASLDGQPLTGSYQPDSDTFVARLPAGTTGHHLLEARGRGCGLASIGLDAP